MARPLLALLALLAAVPSPAQGPLEPSGRLPPVAAPATAPSPDALPKKAKPVEAPAAPMTRGAVLEQVSGIVRGVDRRQHRFTVDAGGEPVTLSMDRNTMVYTPAGLGTVLDVVPGAAVRAGRNADFVAYWVQVRPPAGKGAAPAEAGGSSPQAGGPAGARPGLTAPDGGAAPGPAGAATTTPAAAPAP